MKYRSSSRTSRRSLRLPDYDYSQPGAYFVTIITRQRECLFGKIVNSKMQPNEAGKIVWDVWKSLPARYPHISIDAAVVMPNHFHGIVIIEEYPANSPSRVGAAVHELPLHETPLHETPLHETSLQERMKERRVMTLPLVMGYFKMNSAKRINELLKSPGIPVWHRNYYEHIVRGDITNSPEKTIDAIRKYIHYNPSRWNDNEENQ